MTSLPAVAQNELSPATSTEVDNCRSGMRFPSVSVTLLRVPATSFNCDAVDER